MLREILEAKNFELDSEQLKNKLEKLAEEASLKIKDFEIAKVSSSKSFVKYLIKDKNKFYLAILTETDADDYIKELKLEKVK